MATLAAEVSALQAAAAASSRARDVAVPAASSEGPGNQSNTATAEIDAARAVSEAEVRQLRGWLADMTARHDALAVALAEAHQCLASSSSSSSSTSGGTTEEERAVWAQRVAELESQLLQVRPDCPHYAPHHQ